MKENKCKDECKWNLESVEPRRYHKSGATLTISALISVPPARVAVDLFRYMIEIYIFRASSDVYSFLRTTAMDSGTWILFSLVMGVGL